MSDYDFSETRVIVAALDKDYDEVRGLLADFLPSELRGLATACEVVQIAASDRLAALEEEAGV